MDFDFSPLLNTSFMDPSRLPVAMLAILLCAVIGMITGPFMGRANPFIWAVVSLAVGGLGDRLDKKQRSGVDLMFRGYIITALAMLMALIITKGAEILNQTYPFYGLTEAFILCTQLSIGSVWFLLFRLYSTMRDNKAGQGAYFSIAQTARINLAAGDDFGISRAAMGMCARLFDKALIAPLFWYLIGGFELCILYGVLSALVWRFGKNGFSMDFAGMAMTLEKLMGLIPNLIAGVFLTLAAFLTPTARTHKAMAAWFGFKNRAPYEEGGVPVSVMAWALNISLGGAVQDLTGEALKRVWVGPIGSTAKLDPQHLRRAIYLYIVASILVFGALCGLYVLIA